MNRRPSRAGRTIGTLLAAWLTFPAVPARATPSDGLSEMVIPLAEDLDGVLFVKHIATSGGTYYQWERETRLERLDLSRSVTESVTLKRITFSRDPNDGTVTSVVDIDRGTSPEDMLLSRPCMALIPVSASAWKDAIDEGVPRIREHAGRFRYHAADGHSVPLRPVNAAFARRLERWTSHGWVWESHYGASALFAGRDRLYMVVWNGSRQDRDQASADGPPNEGECMEEVIVLRKPRTFRP